MAEPSTVARPYAEAAFGLADEAGRLREWSGMLAALAAVAQDPRVLSAIGDPALSDAQAAGVFISVLAGSLEQHWYNFQRTVLVVLFPQFIANTPGKNGDVVAVAANHVGQVFFSPFFKKIIRTLEPGRTYIPALQPFALWVLPFVKSFVQHQQAQLVAKLIKIRRLRIVAGADGIHPYFF